MFFFLVLLGKRCNDTCASISRAVKSNDAALAARLCARSSDAADHLRVCHCQVTLLDAASFQGTYARFKISAAESRK